MRSRRNAAVTAAAMVIVAGPLLALCGCGQSTSPPSHATQLRFPFTGEPVSSLNRVLLRIPPTSNDAERDLRPAKPSRRSPAGSAPGKRPASGTQSAAISPPPPSTASTSWPSCVTPSPDAPGCRLFPTRPDPALLPPGESHASVPAESSVGKSSHSGRRPWPSPWSMTGCQDR
jgi:hypothetical protein